MTQVLTDEEVIAAGYNSGDPNGLLEFGRGVEAAVIAKLNKEKPVCYAVIEPSEYVNFTAEWPEACQEHINDAINEHGFLEANYWKVIKLYTTPQPDRTAELEAALREALASLNTLKETQNETK